MKRTVSEDPLQLIDADFVEKGVLGAVLIDPELYSKCSVLSAEDFYYPLHKQIFEAMIALHGHAIEISFLTVASWIGEKNFEVFFRLKDHACLESFDYMISRVKACSQRRRALSKLEQTMNALGDWDSDLLARVKNYSDEVIALLAPDNTPWESLGSNVMELVKDLENPPMLVRTGIKPIDYLVGGYRPGDLWVIAGRTSMGKSALAQSLALNLAAADAPSGYVSIEGSNSDTRYRMVAIKSGVPLSTMRSGNVSMFEAQTLTNCVAKLDDLPVILINADRNWHKLANIIRRAKADVPKLKAVFVDYLSFLSIPGFKNRWDEVRAITTGMKNLAQELEITVVAICQISRATEQRKDHRPTLGDLRESGGVEEDADLIMLLYRPGYYNKNSDDKSAEIIIAKQRNGPTGTISLTFDPSTMRWHEELD